MSQIEPSKTLRLTSIAFVLLMAASVVEAQQAGTPARVGYLDAASYAANKSRVEAFRQGLREAGYIERQNIVIGYRYADGKFARLPALAAELVRLDADVIVSGGSVATGPAKKATATIPIVMTNDPDPVANGFVASLARPGGNVTGLATLSPAISGKRLEILNEIVPKLSRVAVFGSSTEPNDAQALKEVELTPKALGIELQYIDVRGSKDLDAGFTDARNGRADALLVLSGARFVFQLPR